MVVKDIGWRANGNDGTGSNTTVTNGVSGDKALTFNGSDEWITVPHNNSLSFTNNFSIAGWFKRSSATNHAIVTKSDDSGNDRPNYMIDISSNKIRLFGYEGASPIGITSLSGSTIEINKWYFVVGTFDGTTWNLYLNGELDRSSEQAATLTVTTDSLVIGSRLSTGSVYFNGTIDKVIIFDKVLTNLEVKDLYHKQLGGRR